jgi:hypothetical protein
MRLAPMTVFMAVLYLMIGIFDVALDPQLQGYGNGGTGFLFATLFQPWNWSGTINLPLVGAVPSFLSILGVAITVSVGVALLGSILGRSDIANLFPLFIALTTLGAMPCLVLYNFVSRNIGQMAGCDIMATCVPANVIGALVAGVLAIMWLFTCLEWWAWRSTTI